MNRFSALFRLAAGLILLAACAPAVPTPTITPSPLPSLTPSPIPTETPAPTVEAATEEPSPIPLQLTPLGGFGSEPPLTMDFPDGWAFVHDTYALADVDALRAVPITYYQGPVTGGTGVIVVLWGFPNLANPFPDPNNPDAGTPNLWADGLRLFRLALVDAGCNSGTDIQRTYRIGNQSAVGTQFSIIDCPESPDTRGWFAGVQVNGLNFVFFVYTDPIDAMTTAQSELQAILDTVVFSVPEG